MFQHQTFSFFRLSSSFAFRNPLMSGQYGTASMSYGNSQHSASNNQNNPPDTRLLSKQRLTYLIDSLAGTQDFNIDEVAEEIIQDLVDEYVNTSTRVACMLAKHRHSDKLEPRDVRTALKKQPRS